MSDELVQEICSSWPRSASNSNLSSYHPQLRLHFKMIQGILEVGSHTSLKIFCLLTHSQRLAHFLDRPLFPWRRLIIGFSLGQFCLENWLLGRQYGVYQRTVRPKA